MAAVPENLRYSIITIKNPREIVLLRGTGCQWRRCRFCDYHLDFSHDMADNEALNRRVLSLVSGKYGVLECINSGSFVDLGTSTLEDIRTLCVDKKIGTIHFESHWMHREQIAPLREYFLQKDIKTKMKIGVETFDSLFRESYLDKGMSDAAPTEIAAYFDEVCLLQGIPGQTVASMKRDIETGLAYFERVCVNIMTANTKPIMPDPQVISLFLNNIEPEYRDNPRVDILLNNTDFGVGV